MLCVKGLHQINMNRMYIVFLPCLFLRMKRVRFIFMLQGAVMETRVAVMSIIVEERETADTLNQLLHQYGEYIIGRMGIPYRQKNIHIISIAIDAPQDTIAALSGRIGKLPGISVKTAYSQIKP